MTFYIKNMEVKMIETALVAALPNLGGPAISLLIVCFMYLKIQSKRKETKNERDKDSQELHDKILKHDFEITNLKGEFAQQRNINDDLNKQVIELSKAVATFSVAVDTLTETVRELKSDVKQMK